MQKRILYIDGIKGLICIPVFLCHFLGDFHISIFRNNIVLRTILMNGNFSVCVFLIMIFSFYSSFLNFWESSSVSFLRCLL